MSEMSEEEKSDTSKLTDLQISSVIRGLDHSEIPELDFKVPAENSEIKETNVVEFPLERYNSPPQSREELLAKIEEYRTSFAEEIAEALCSLVLGEMARSGCRFDIDVEMLQPSMALILESIKSLHLQTSGIHHPLQDIAEELYGEESDSNRL